MHQYKYELVVEEYLNSTGNLCWKATILDTEDDNMVIYETEDYLEMEQALREGDAVLRCLIEGDISYLVTSKNS